MREFLKKNYHWIIAAMALLQLLVYGGLVNNFTGYHLIPVTEELEISRTAFSLASSLRSVVSMLCTMFSGAMIRRFGYRITASAGLATAGIGYVLYATMKSYPVLLVGAVLMGISYGFCATSAISRLLNGWFHKYRGTVLGLVTAATGIGSSLLGIAQVWAIDNVSWRLSFGIGAVLQLGFAVLMYLLVRNKPEDIGLRPFGEGQVDPTVKKNRAPRWAGFTMEQLKKRPAFYLLILFAFLSCFCTLVSQYNLVPYFQDCGMSATRAGKIYGTMMFLLGFVKLGFGALCDWIGPKRVTLLCHLACCIGLTMVMVLPQTDMAMIGALILFDMANPLTTIIFPLLSMDLFGYQGQNQYIGTITAMTAAANIVSGPVANTVRDTMGTYRPVYWGAIALSACMLFLYPLLFAMVKKDRKKLEEMENAAG